MVVKIRMKMVQRIFALGWMAALLPVGVLMLVSSAPARASEFAIAFKNRTCGEILLSATGNDSCFGAGGCELSIPRNGTERVALREGVRPRWARVTIKGTCEEEPPVVIEGSCAIDLSRLFRPGGYHPTHPGRGTGEIKPGEMAAPPIFEQITGPFDPGVAFASVDIGLGICEDMADGRQHCAVACGAD